MLNVGHVGVEAFGVALVVDFTPKLRLIQTHNMAGVTLVVNV